MARLSSQDPLEKFRFKVEILTSAGDSAATLVNLKAGFKEVQMPKRSTNKILYRDSLSPEIHMISPGLSNTEDITLSRGLVAADSFGFYYWASESHTGGPTDAAFNHLAVVPYGSASGALNYKDNMKKDLLITVFDRTGAPARAWKVYNAFVVNFIPGSDLNATEDSEKAMESITICYEDFEEVKVADNTSVVNPTAAETLVTAEQTAAQA